MDIKIENLENQIIQLNNTVQILTNNIKDLTIIIQNTNNMTVKMDNHIDFIENIYETVKSPLNYITGKINNIKKYENVLIT